MDTAFDVLNSKSQFGKRNRSGISAENLDKISQCCSDFSSYLLALQTKEGAPLHKSRRKTFVLGFICTFTSILSLAKLLLREEGFEYILTFRFSQDHIETLFSKIRRMGGFNNNPTASHFRFALRKLLAAQSIKSSKYANVLDCESTTSVFGFQWSKRKSSTVEADVAIDVENLLPMINSHVITSPITDNVLYYISGYIVRSMSGSVKCNECAEALVDVGCGSTSPNSHLTRVKNTGGLVFPSQAVFKIVRFAENIFKRCVTTELKTMTNPRLKTILVTLFNRAVIEDQPIQFFVHDCSIELGFLSHTQQLTKCIVEKFFDIRLKHHRRIFNQQVVLRNQTSDRSRLNRLIIFKNQ